MFGCPSSDLDLLTCPRDSNVNAVLQRAFSFSALTETAFKSLSTAAISLKGSSQRQQLFATLQTCQKPCWDTKSNQVVVKHSLLCRISHPPKFSLHFPHSLLNAQSSSSHRASTQLSILCMLSRTDAWLFFSFHLIHRTEKPFLSSQANKTDLVHHTHMSSVTISLLKPEKPPQWENSRFYFLFTHRFLNWLCFFLAQITIKFIQTPADRALFYLQTEHIR